MKTGYFIGLLILAVCIATNIGNINQFINPKPNFKSEYHNIINECHASINSPVDKQSPNSIADKILEHRSLLRKIEDFNDTLEHNGISPDKYPDLSDIHLGLTDDIRRLSSLKWSLENNNLQEHHESTVTASTHSALQNSSAYDLNNTTKTCTWCGRAFTGEAWTVSLGEPIQWKYSACCSEKCAIEHYNSQRE